LSEAFQVFVYGTLKPGERAFGKFCQPYVVEVVDAIAPGRLYHLPLGYPAMTLEAGWVKGALLTFTTLAIFDQMDAFEDYYPDRPEDSDYLRIHHGIYSPDRVPLAEAWVYVMARERVDAAGGQWLTSGEWSGQHFSPLSSEGKIPPL
jgi:gamma-glutamylcyclotransferase (GGCT)/AIG2-like uncharacterized protein YtfP